MKINCCYCKKEYNSYRVGVNHFCSKICYGKYKSEHNDKKEWHEVKCLTCGKVVKKLTSVLKKNGGKAFCSRFCYAESRRTFNTVAYVNKKETQTECICCGKSFIIKNWRFKGHGKHCCSTECNRKVIGKSFRLETTPLYKAIRTSSKMFEWRIAVYTRDGNKCRICGAKSKNVHHIIHFKDLLGNSNVKTLDDVYNYEPLWDVDNGISLCLECHKNEHKKK